MSTFTKKMIYVDENLSKVIGYNISELVSYSEITKGIYEYIKKNDLKKEPDKKKLTEKFCFNCGNKLPSTILYCDKCGKKQ